MAAIGKDNPEKWLAHVKESLEKDDMEVSKENSPVCVFGVAHTLLKVKPEAYIPQVISIGPYYHRRLQHYEETDTYKVKMVRTLERNLHGFKFDKLVNHIRLSEPKIRACYDRHILYSSEVICYMLALDTLFILQFLRSTYFSYVGNNVERNDVLNKLDPVLPFTRKSPLWYAIKNDMLMLENQLPLFLLNEALCLVATNGKAKFSHSDKQVGGPSRGEIFQEEEDLTAILQAACMYYNPFPRDNGSPPPPPDLHTTGHVLDYLHHYIADSQPGQHIPEPEEKFSLLKKILRDLRDLISHEVRISFFLSVFKKMISASTAGSLPSATELNEAGVQFAPCSSGELRDISFNRRSSTFYLPKITINDSTEVVLRNLVALELYLDKEEKPLTRYTYLMDRLIDTQRDVALLKRCRILDSQMGSDREVAQMWNSMSKSIWENSFQPVDKAMEAANKYYRSTWRVLFAEFVKTHFSKPWLVISVLSAGMLLLLTGVQVFCLFYTCNKNSSWH